MDPVFINETVNTVVTRGLVLGASTPEFRKITMMQVVHAILSNKVNRTDLATASAAIGGNATEFARELNAVLADQPHGGNFSEAMYVAGIVLSSITSMTVVLRLCSRKLLGLSFKAEDYLIVVALFLSLVFASLMQHSTLYGGGTHIWDVSFDNVSWVTRCLFICEFMYTGSIIAVKSSLLIFFYRLSAQRTYRISVISVATFFGLMSVAMAFAMAFQCKPIAWYKDVLGRQCFDELAFWTAFGALCIASDIMILLLPIPVVWNLQLKTKDKIGVTALFSLGAIVCVASGLRLRTLQGFVKSVDFTSREGAFGLWCVVELDTAIICASVPACKGLFTRFAAPRISSIYRGGGDRSRTKKSQVINTFNSTAPADKAVFHNPHLHGDDRMDLDDLPRSRKGTPRADLFAVGDDEDEVPFSNRDQARSSVQSGAISINMPVNADNEDRPPLPRDLQVPGVFYGHQRESASTLGDDLEAARSQTQEDVTFGGLSPRNST